MVRARLVAQLEHDRVGARAQFHRDAMHTKGLLAAEVEDIVVHAQQQCVVPGQVQGRVRRRWRVQDAAGQGRARVRLAHVPSYNRKSEKQCHRRRSVREN